MSLFRWGVLFLLASIPCWAKSSLVLKKIDVGGGDKAEVQFRLEGNATAAPNWQIRENTVEVSFPGTEISEELASQLDVSSPHALVSRIRLFPGRDGSVKAKITINGSEAKLKERVQLRASNGQALLTIEYPKSGDATLSLLKDEQKPVFSVETPKEVRTGGMGWLQSLLLILLLGGAGAGTYFGAKYLKKQGHIFGSRKFLIETLAYSPVGPAGKAGVGIVKVGGEFVLVGVTANHVSLLSHLPKLEAQYQDESKLERDTFREAVEEQVRELGSNSMTGRRKGPGVSA
jgi:flagellar biogenesis protein FliO